MSKNRDEAIWSKEAVSSAEISSKKRKNLFAVLRKKKKKKKKMSIMFLFVSAVLCLTMSPSKPVDQGQRNED